MPVTVTVTSGPVTSGPQGHGRGGQVRGQRDFGPPLTRPRPLPSPAPNPAAEAPKCVEVVKSEVRDLRSVTVTSDLTTSTHFGASAAGFGAGLGSGRGRVRGGIQAHTSEEPRQQKEQAAVMAAQEVAERQSPFRAPEEEEEEEEEGGGGGGVSPRLFKAKAGADAKVAEEGERKGDGDGSKDGSSAQPELTGARCRTVGMARSANTDADASVPELEDRPVKTTGAPPPLPPPLPPPDTGHGEPGRDKGQAGPGGGGGRVTPRNSWHFFEEDYERKMVVDELVVRRQLALYMRRGWEHDKRVLRMTVPLKRGSASRILARPGGGAMDKDC